MTTKTSILVTRSGEGGQHLAAWLSSHGLRSILYAPVQLRAVADRARMLRQLQDCLPTDILIAPSAEALRQLAEGSDPVSLGFPLVVVPGPGTAAVGARLGFGPIIYPPTEGSSERILELPELAHVRGARILVAAAVGGRQLIARQLAERGALVRQVSVYRRLGAAPTAETVARIVRSDALITLWASGGAVVELQRQVPQSCWRVIALQRSIAPSERVARLARTAGCCQVTVATGADDRSMLDAIAALCPSLPVIGYPDGGKPQIGEP